MSETSLELAEIFRLYGDAYRQNHPLPKHHRGVMAAIENCRTAALGGRLYICDHCGTEVPLYNSCGNRHCPKCQALDKEKWLEARTGELLPVPYFHVVFTVPHTLHPLFRGNPTTLYNMLFRASKETLLQIAADPQHLGAQIGFTGVLHTWSSDLALHPHTHYVVPGGGLSPERDRWVEAPSNFLLHVDVLSEVFRGKFVDFLDRAYHRRQLNLRGPLAEFQHPVRFQDLTDQLYSKNWVVYCKPPFAEPQHVLKYLARYTHRVAISNDRLIRLEDDHVVFRFKNYKQGNVWQTKPLPAFEFIRRFLQHVLPPRFVRIRYFGLLANRKRQENLERARGLLNAPPPPPVAPEEESWQEMLVRLTGDDPTLCPHCGKGHLQRYSPSSQPRAAAGSPRAPP